MAAQKQVLLDRLGGEEALKLAVERFYEKNVADKELAKFFEGVDILSLQAHQYKFMKLAFTEIPEGVDVVAVLKRAHGRLFDMGLSEVHFDLVAGNLVAALQELDVDSKIIGDAVAVVAPLRDLFEEQAKARSQGKNTDGVDIADTLNESQYRMAVNGLTEEQLAMHASQMTDTLDALDIGTGQV